jgi:hypothetical protein
MHCGHVAAGTRQHESPRDAGFGTSFAARTAGRADGDHCIV